MFALAFSNTVAANKIAQTPKGVNQGAIFSSDLFCGVQIVTKKGAGKSRPLE
jgi:hypothetical protein